MATGLEASVLIEPVTGTMKINLLAVNIQVSNIKLNIAYNKLIITYVYVTGFEKTQLPRTIINN